MYPQPVGLSEYEVMQAQKRDEADQCFESWQAEQKRAKPLVYALLLLFAAVVAGALAGLWWLGRVLWHWWHVRYGF